MLRGEIPEDQYFSGENLRGYFARAGRVEHPVGLAPTGGDGYTVHDPSRPADPNADAFQELINRFEQRMPDRKSVV